MTRYLGLDLGSRTLGLALSTSGILASTYTTLRFKDDDYEDCLNQLKVILEKEKIDVCVLGLPKHMNGDVGIRGQISYDFKAKLEELGYKVVLQDERLSTVSADNLMLQGNFSREKRREKKDELAAQIILQNYLDKLNH